MGTHVEKLQATGSSILEIGEKSVFEQLLEGRSVSPRDIQFSLFQDAIKSEKQEYFLQKPAVKCPLKRSNSVGNMSRNMKRRLTFSGFQDIKHPIRRRRRLNSMALPTKFLLGGDITDPLNLKSLTDDEGGRRLNSLTPISSPIPMSTRHTEIEVLVPPNIYDPLNLNSGEDIEFNLMSAKPRKRKCRHQHIRQYSESSKDAIVLEEKGKRIDCMASNETEHDDCTACDQSAELYSSACSCSSDQLTSSDEQSTLSLDLSTLPSDQSTLSSDQSTLPCNKSAVLSDDQSEWSSGDQSSSALNIKFTSSSSSSFSEQESKTSLEIQSLSVKTVESEKHVVVGVISSGGSDLSGNQSKSVEEEVLKIHRPKLSIKLPENIHDETFSMDKIVSPVVPQGSSVVNKSAGSKEAKSSAASQSSFKFPRKRFSQERDSLVNTDFKKSDEKYATGSFPFHYRCNFGDDIRLNLFSKELFYGKEVLDIGCNIGCLAMNIAEHFEPSKVICIDVCPKIIDQARKHLQRHVNKFVAKNEDFPISMASVYGPLVRMALPPTEGCDELFPNNIIFHCVNYVPDSEEDLQLHQVEYDVILCLRVSKWIHLNSGDEGLKSAFKRMFSQLRFGGHLILEFQPWSSYGVKKKLSPVVFMNYKSIQMKPKKFIPYLLSAEVGFSSCKVLGQNSTGQPLFILTKGIDMNLCEDAHHSSMVSPVVFNDIEWSGCYEDEDDICSGWEGNEDDDYPEGLPPFQDDAHYGYYQDNQMLMDNYFVSPECDSGDDM